MPSVLQTAIPSYFTEMIVPEKGSLNGCVCVVIKGKSKVFPYSLPSVGPGADPGVQAVSPQVT